MVDPFDRLIGFYDIFVCDLTVVDTDSFIETNQMGRSIKADAVTGFVYNGREGGCNRALSVCSRYVDAAKIVLRIAQCA
jgi:hypothetical protein